MRRLIPLSLRTLNIFFALFLSLSAFADGGYYQWKTQLTGCHSTETDGFPYAHLWIPEGCEKVKAVLLAQQNMTEERIFKMASFRQRLSEMGVAEVWVGPAFSMDWSPMTECQAVFEQMMRDLATTSGHEELAAAPIIPLGHSAQATFPWNFAAWNPDRTLCIISFHGDAPRTNLCGYGRENIEWGRTRNIDGIPGLMVEGEYEWWEARVNPALAFRMMYPESCVSFLCDTGRGHFDCSERTALYLARFIEKSLERRLQADGSLFRLNPKDGWLVERYRSEIPSTDGTDKGKQPVVQEYSAKPAPYEEYTGDRHDAFWYFDEEMAVQTFDRYTETRGKKQQFLGIKHNGKFLPVDSSGDKVTLELDKISDDMTFTLEPVYTDPSHAQLSKEHGKENPRMEIICGPAEQIDDYRFRLYSHEMGLGNPHRSFTIWLCAVTDGDEHYKGAVLPLSIRLK